MAPSLFKYECLSEPDSFRIILLQPSTSHDTPLHCTLLHTTLSQCDCDIIDHYTALSYVWGDATRYGCIFVDEKIIDITTTLEAALRDLRDRTRIMRIWADAICINQKDDNERAVQVGLMARIYSTAHHTVIYLGPRTREADILLSICPSNTTGTVNREHSRPQIELAGDEMLKLAWFSRVWIFQELVFS
jgi:heterokaryon incompatibility protein (HET)